MTRRALARFGVTVGVDTGSAQGMRLEVPAGSRPRACPVTIPGDWSSAAFLLCAGALAGKVRVDGLPSPNEQADSAVAGCLKASGAALDGTVLDGEVAGGGRGGWIEAGRADLSGIDVNLAHCPDLFPVLAVTLAQAEGASRLYGAPHLRSKETDRIALMAHNLRRQGAEIEELPDGLWLRGGATLRGGEVETGGDHRVLMAFAAGAARAAAPMLFPDADADEVAAVSYPGFFRDLRALGADVVKR
jgi:3-phosphoshikimate 1-carboxyvinyltransferase